MSRIGTVPDDDLASWIVKSPARGGAIAGVQRLGTTAAGCPCGPVNSHEMFIAHGNECKVVDDELYEHALQWRTWPGYGEQERLAAEFAHRFATEHTALRDDEDFWTRCSEHFSEELLADLALSCAL